MKGNFFFLIFFKIRKLFLTLKVPSGIVVGAMENRYRMLMKRGVGALKYFVLSLLKGFCVL